MKKSVKLLSLLMVLIMALSMFTGCITVENNDVGEDADPFDMTIGIPVSTKDESWSDWEFVLASVVNDFKMFYNINVKFTKVPTEGKALKKFMKKVDNGKVACFFSDRQAFIDELIENKNLLSLETLQGTYDTLLEKAPDGIIALAENEMAIKTYMYPIYGTFQGLYYNRTMFKEYELANPTSWESILAAVTVLKEKGVTPIAAGFADEGLEYMIDELVLSEGGSAEHSYQPSFGVVSSWERAVNDVKTLEAAGAFTANCYNVKFETAVRDFLDGKAAMIVAPSTAFGGELSADDVKVVGFPTTPTGKREAGAFVGRLDHGFYISSAYFNSGDRERDSIFELMNTDYLGGADFYEIFMDESTFCPNPEYYADFKETKMDDALNALVSKAEVADWPMRDRIITMDTTVESFRKALTGTPVEVALQAAADAEIAAIKAEEENAK